MRSKAFIRDIGTTVIGVLVAGAIMYNFGKTAGLRDASRGFDGNRK